MSSDKTELLGDATPVEEQIGSLELDELENADLTQVTGGAAPVPIATSGGKCGHP